MPQDAPQLDPADATAQWLCKRVTDLRKKQRLTLDQLAAKSGVSRSMLSQIERGQANPTLAVTFRIAQSFDLTIGELLNQPNAADTIEVVHGGDASNLFRNDPDIRIRTLSPLHMEKAIEFYELRLAPGASLTSGPHFEGTKELFTLTQGQALIGSGAGQQAIAAGDTAHYRADVGHRIVNTADQELVGYLVVTGG